MKKQMIGFLMLTVMLTSTSGIALMIRPTYAGGLGNDVLNQNFMEKIKASPLGEGNGLGAKQNDAKIPSQTLQDGTSKWNFNDTSEWSKYAFAEGNETRLIVGVDPERSNGLLRLEEIASRHHARIVDTVSIGGQIRAAVVELLMISVTAFVEEVHVIGLANYVEPDMKVQTLLVPNDPYWSLQWGPHKIGADWAWDVTVGDPSLIVAVVDTGIDYTHPDLAANYVPLGFDWVNTDPDPLDDFGHGTHCAGIIAAALNNGIGIAGLAQVKIMAEKVLNNGGSGYWDWVANGIAHAVDQGAKIISMSLGGYGDSELVHDAVKYAYNAGVLVIAAAGNDDTNTKSYPAAYDEVVAVAATDISDQKVWFSNWGDWIELAAPGESIYSTMPTYHVTLNDWGYGMYYDYLSGTSMACPHVSGVAALVWSLYPHMPRDWVRLWLRSTADDLGAPGFDVYYGYGRVNAQKAIMMSPPSHELIAYDLITPPFAEPGAPATINASVLNFGVSDEDHVTVQLFANDSFVDSATIDFLASGNSTTVSLTWNPAVVGAYNVTAYVLPVAGETNVENNVISKSVYCGTPVKAVVLHSAGNVIGEIITNWQVLTSEWQTFGDTMVYIDYTTLNKADITYEDIAATKADVLIISCAYDPYSGWEFTDSEIEAIAQYAHEGHGLIATAGTFYNMVPNNDKLAPLFGINQTTMGDSAVSTDLLHLLNITHPICKNVPNPLVFPLVGSALPLDGRWDFNELAGGKYLALGHFQEGAIVVYRGLVYISPWLEVVPAYYHHQLQLLYNAIMWSRYQKPEHELVASLEAPEHLKPGESALLTGTVTNKGRNNETNVELDLFIDGVLANSSTISKLEVESSYSVSYVWTPSAEKTYNITAYALPVFGEEITGNNQATKFVSVSKMAIAVVLDSFGTDYAGTTFWDYLNLNWAMYGDLRVVIDYTSLNKEGITLADIEATHADVLIISDAWSDTYYYGWEFSDSEIEAIKTYVLQGHGIIATSGTFDTWTAPNNQKLAELFGMDSTIWYNWGSDGDQKETDGVFDLLTPRHDELWKNIADPYLGGSMVTLNPIPSSDWTMQGVTTGWMEALSTDHLAAVITNEDVHKAVYFTCMLELQGQYDENNRQLFYNAIAWAQLPSYEHDLGVTLVAPTMVRPGASVFLNATVRNHGLSNETDVELFLMIDGSTVDNVTIPELPSKTSYTLNYLWTPTIEGTYNTTAYAPPLVDEGTTENNFATKIVTVRQVKYILFDQTHGTDGVFGYSVWTNSLTERGYIIDTHFAGPITPIVLRNYDVFVIPQAHDSYTLDELSAIQSFVFGGGGLLVIGDDNPWVYTDLTGFAGITWESGGTSGITRDITPHPVTTDVSSVYLDAPIAVMHVSGDAQNLVRDPTGGIMLAVSEQPGGKVLGFADEGSLWDYAIQYEDNLRLANNMIDWLAIPIRLEHDLAVTLDAPESLAPASAVLLNATVRNRGLTNETEVELQLLIDSTIVDSAVIPELTSQASYTLSYLWAPFAQKVYNVTGYAPPVSGEELMKNNFASQMVSVKYSPKLLVVDTPMPEDTAALDKLGYEYTLATSAEFATVDLYDYNVLFVGWLPGNDLVDALLARRFDIALWLAAGNGIVALSEFDEVNRWAWLPLSVDGSAYHADIVHILEPTHPVMLNLTDSELTGWGNSYHCCFTSYDPSWENLAEGVEAGYPITLATRFGAGRIVITGQDPDYHFYYQGYAGAGKLLRNMIEWATPYGAEEDHDVAVVDVTISTNLIYQGWTVKTNVTVANLGKMDETFNVTLYYNNTEIWTQKVLNLAPNTMLTISLTWNTVDVPFHRNYTLTAQADIVPGETNIWNNILVDGRVTIRIWGDINGDGIVNYLDAITLGQSWNSRPGDVIWSLPSDLNRDRIINYLDAIIIGDHFAESYYH